MTCTTVLFVVKYKCPGERFSGRFLFNRRHVCYNQYRPFCEDSRPVVHLDSDGTTKGAFAMKNLRGKSGIYSITNIENGNSYIGKAIDLSKRKSQHFYALRVNRHFNSYLQRAYNKYGEAKFTFAVIEFVEDPSEQMKLRALSEREQYWISKNKPQYNMVVYTENEIHGDHINFVEGDDSPIVIKHWQKYVQPKWVEWVYGGARNPILYSKDNK